MIRVLFVCVHNSARSQMAETLMNDLGQGMFIAESAGLRPGELNEDVIDSMAELGYNIKDNKTKSVFDFYKEGRRFHYVIKVCDQINGQKCPIFPATKKQFDWNHEDPSSFEGDKENRLNQVRVIRDEIKRNVMQFIAYYQVQQFDYRAAQDELNTIDTPLDINDIVVEHQHKKFIGVRTSFFIKQEQKEFGESVEAITNGMLLTYARFIKKTYLLDRLTVSHVLSLMEELWDIIYPIQQGSVSIEALTNGLEFFSEKKNMNINPKYRKFSMDDNDTTKKMNVDFVESAFNDNKSLLLMSLTDNENHMSKTSWSIIMKNIDGGIYEIKDGEAKFLEHTDLTNKLNVNGFILHW